MSQGLFQQFVQITEAIRSTRSPTSQSDEKQLQSLTTPAEVAAPGRKYPSQVVLISKESSDRRLTIC